MGHEAVPCRGSVDDFDPDGLALVHHGGVDRAGDLPGGTVDDPSSRSVHIACGRCLDMALSMLYQLLMFWYWYAILIEHRLCTSQAFNFQSMPVRSPRYKHEVKAMPDLMCLVTIAAIVPVQRV
jgi:hypothetical protein